MAVFSCFVWTQALQFHSPHGAGLLRFTRHAGVARPAFRPTAQAVDLLVHCFGQRHRLGQGNQYGFGRDFLFGVKRIVKGAVDGFLDFRAAGVLAGPGQRLQIKLVRFPPAPVQMNPENFLSFLLAG